MPEKVLKINWRFFSVFALLAIVAGAYALDELCDDELFAFRAHPDRCESFIMCMMNRAITFTCDNNFIWDQDRSRCRLGNPHTCEFRFGPEPSCEDQLFSIHYQEDTCTAFFICMMGRRIDFTCGDGEIFDSYNTACVPGDSFLCIPDAPQPYIE